ncbi:hypothetical protein [Pseudochryseolinea flava]|uniref:Uncharacterized protein n=1 Tax=Pseudochryseolinea flava TaxID=2059302 RepID=A0A364XXH1_9BACT|nr:hypothetical protein [Pseudochryseolinea flava]RAV98997.1 hypothetical protein DQQ10_20585 [Pseudochryseolinea flava]
MVEVFKTNVRYADDAIKLITELHRLFDHYHANFDLSDCDRILRVQCVHHTIDADAIIALIQQRGFHAEVLEDIVIHENS